MQQPAKQLLFLCPLLLLVFLVSDAVARWFGPEAGLFVMVGGPILLLTAALILWRRLGGSWYSIGMVGVFALLLTLILLGDVPGMLAAAAILVGIAVVRKRMGKGINDFS